jgi:DNA-binding CsgD family transcriptional regulator
MKDFLTYIEKFNNAPHEAALFESFVEGMDDLGFDRVSFNILTDHRNLRLKKNLAVLHNLESDVLTEYFSRGYDRNDPVLNHARQAQGPFQWTDLHHVELTPGQRRCLEFRTHEAGYYNGVSAPLYGPCNQRAAFSLFATEESETPDYKSGLLGLYCNYFYLAYQRFHEDKDVASVNVALSPLETDILTWAALGKSDPQICDLLKIGRHTVNTHFRHIFRKLDTNSRIHAVTKAMLLGMINP